MSEAIFFESIGSFLGVAGSVLMALNIPSSRLAFLLFVASHVALLAWGIMNHSVAFCGMQSALLVIDGVAVWRWILKPKSVMVNVI